MGNDVDIVIKENGHYCTLWSDYHAYGEAINECYESKDEKLWSGNGEYGSQVNFCPKCGFKAKVQVEDGE